MEYHIRDFARPYHYVPRRDRVGKYVFTIQGSNHYYEDLDNLRILTSLPESCSHLTFRSSNKLHVDDGPARLILGKKESYLEDWYVYGVKVNEIYEEFI